MHGTLRRLGGMGKKNTRPNVTAPIKSFSFGVERGYTATDDLWKFAATDDLANGIINMDEGETI